MSLEVLEKKVDAMYIYLQHYCNSKGCCPHLSKTSGPCRLSLDVECSDFSTGVWATKTTRGRILSLVENCCRPLTVRRNHVDSRTRTSDNCCCQKYIRPPSPRAFIPLHLRVEIFRRLSIHSTTVRLGCSTPDFR
jgi:hypothetical protein